MQMCCDLSTAAGVGRTIVHSHVTMWVFQQLDQAPTGANQYDTHLPMVCSSANGTSRTASNALATVAALLP